MYYNAANIIYNNKQSLLNTITSWILETYPNRTNDFYKCTRDLDCVITAFINGLRFKSTENIQFILEEFYKDNTLQLQSTDVEIEAYNLLKNNIVTLLATNAETDSIIYFEYLHNELITKLVNGITFTQMNVVKASFIAERCQRNWDFDNPISDSDKNAIIQSTINMPTKQNQLYYKLLVSTNYQFNKICYEYATDPFNPDFDRPLHRNNQVLAPMLMIFMPADPTEIWNPFGDDFHKNFNQSIGIASGVAAHSAAMLGYRTGFCACARWTAMYEKLNQEFDVPIPSANYGLMLGIGHRHPDYSRFDIVVDGVYGYTVNDSGSKCVDIQFVEAPENTIGHH